MNAMWFWLRYMKRYLFSRMAHWRSSIIIQYHRSVHSANISPFAHLKKRVILSGSEKLTLGDFVDIEEGTELVGNVSIGRHTRVGRGCRLISSTHRYDGANALPFGADSFDKGIVIGDFVWIGSGVTILSGVQVGDGSIISAGSVVTVSIPKYAIVLGNPARVIFRRNVTNFERLLRECKFYYDLSPKPLPGPFAASRVFKLIRDGLRKKGYFKYEPSKASSQKERSIISFCMLEFAGKHGMLFGNFGASYIVAPPSKIQDLLANLAEASTEYRDLKALLTR